MRRREKPAVPCSHGYAAHPAISWPDSLPLAAFSRPPYIAFPSLLSDGHPTKSQVKQSDNVFFTGPPNLCYSRDRVTHRHVSRLQHRL